MDGLVVKLDDDDTWECRHVGRSGEPAPATRLRLDQTLELNPGQTTAAPRRWANCPDCGTYWRVWVNLKVGKPSIEASALDVAARSPGCRRAPLLDIDRIIDLVRAKLPGVLVLQHHDVWPGDDEGLWVFQLPSLEHDIQLESGTGMCPFFVEHDENSSGGGWKAASTEEAAKMIVDYLGAQSLACDR